MSSSEAILGLIEDIDESLGGRVLHEGSQGEGNE